MSNLVAKDHLRAFVERIERLESEKEDQLNDIREVYAEAKGSGFDVKALRAIILMRKQDKDELAEHQAVVQLYAEALGMLVGTPLGDSAIQRVERKMARKAARREEARQ